MRKCRYDYAQECGEVTLKVKVTVYPTDHELRETSVREM